MQNPPPNPPPSNANLFEHIAYLVRSAQYLIEEALNTRFTQEQTMATLAELQAALDANTAAVEAAEAAITTEIAQLQSALAELSTSQPPTQAQLDQLNLATSRLAAATQALHADDPAAPTP
jgi:ABC-type transporter Mla subunit MlaD